jgi:hypothetical protein
MEQAIIDNQNFIYYLFNLTAGSLYGLSVLTSLSYQCWNTLIWFGLIPASWIYLIGRKTTPWLNIFSLPIFVYIFWVHTWNSWFDKSVVLLYKMGDWIHSDYKVTSVIVCVFIPILVYFMLFALCTSRKTFKRFAITNAIIAALVIILFPISNWLIPYFVK